MFGCSFCEEGGLQEVLQLLPHPELQYLAMSALVALLGAWQVRCRLSPSKLSVDTRLPARQ